MLNDEGISRPVVLGFIASLCSHSRPLHELLQPNFQDQRETFTVQFAGMAEQTFTYEDYQEARQLLSSEIKNALYPNDKAFLISFKQGMPDWALIDIPRLRDLPAVLWKLKNLQTMIKDNPKKHLKQLRLLQSALDL